jgi:hypothetical protein
VSEKYIIAKAMVNMAPRNILIITLALAGLLAQAAGNSLVLDSSVITDDDAFEMADLDSYYSQDLEELGPGDEDIMDAVFEYRKLTEMKNKKRADGGDDDDDDASNTTKLPKGVIHQQNKTRGDVNGDDDDDGASNSTKAEKDTPKGLLKQNKTRGNGDDDDDDDDGASNSTKAEKDTPKGLLKQNKTRGDGNDKDKKPSGKVPKMPNTLGKPKMTEEGSPIWWEQVKETFKKGKHSRLKRCSMRKTPPLEGESCSKKPKTCFFGSQLCPDILDYPTLKCDCKKRKWTCKMEQCSRCPIARPKEGDSCSIPTLACNYDVQQW